jgi:hypothetical protein
MLSRGLRAALVVVAALAVGCDAGTGSDATPHQSAPTTAAPSATVAAGPTPRGLPLLASCSRPAYRPRTAGMYCADAGVLLEQIHWNRWSRSIAIANATVTVQGDASGHGGGSYRARVTFWKPTLVRAGLTLFRCATFRPPPLDPAERTINLAYTAWPTRFEGAAGSADACDRL